jgi:hypothetical protein
MANINDDIVYRYSGGGTAATSLGGTITGASILTSSDQNLFQNINTAEALAGSDKYACIYIVNTGLTTYTNVGIYISSETLSPKTKIFIDKDPIGLNGVAQSIPDNITGPGNVIWQRPLFSYQALSLPSMTTNSYHAIWLKRVTDPATAGSASDYFRLSMVSA